MTEDLLKELPANLVFVDVEGHGPAPTLNDPIGFEFGAVTYPKRQSFHGKGASKQTFTDFAEWLTKNVEGRPVFVSDNNGYDSQFINYYFHLHLGYNPFGHSSRRISDWYSGLNGNWHDTQSWKKLRTPAHNHDPVIDALGNLNAFDRLMKGERP